MTDFDNIPDELQGREQWLYWNASSDKPRKPLASPAADYGCSWSDPDEWHDFETVREAAEAVPQAGIGFVNAQDNDDYPRGIIGSIDIDGAVDERGRARDWVPSMDCFAERDAYQEWSPSETGLRIPVIGLDIPDWWSDFEDIDGEHKGVELLTNKFSTYTGNMLRGAGEEPVEYGDWLEDWLREVHKTLAGEDPLAQGGIDRFGGDSGGPGASDEYDDEWLTEEVAREALSHIDPDLGHDRWRDIGFALEDHFPQRTAKRLFERWSRGGSKWDSSAEREVQSIVSGGGSGVTVATLIDEAKQAGWDVSEHTQPSGRGTMPAGGSCTTRTFGRSSKTTRCTGMTQTWASISARARNAYAKRSTGTCASSSKPTRAARSARRSAPAPPSDRQRWVAPTSISASGTACWRSPPTR